MPLTRIKSLGITDGTITAADLATGVGGKILQVVSASDSIQRSTSSTTYVTASNTLSVSITPSSASNKIFILVTGSLYIDTSSTYGNATIFKDGSNLNAKGFAKTYDGGHDNGSTIAMSYYDSGGDTSSHTFDVRIKANSGTVYLNIDGDASSGGWGQIIAMEIKG